MLLKLCNDFDGSGSTPASILSMYLHALFLSTKSRCPIGTRNTSLNVSRLGRKLPVPLHTIPGPLSHDDHIEETGGACIAIG